MGEKSIIVRLDDSLVEKLDLLARQDNRSRNAELIVIIQEAVKGVK